MSEENKTTESQTEKETLTENAEAQVDDASQTQDQTSEDSNEQKEQTPEERIAELENEVADLKDQLLRRAADFDNYRKRMLKEKQETFDYANATLLGDLLESLDNFDRTIEAAKDATDPKSIADGIKMINTSLVKMLEEKYGLVGYGAEGEEFNPDEHEAIGRCEDENAKTETLKQVYLKGYKLKQKIIRHAKVMVNVPKQ